MELINLKGLNLTMEESRDIIKFIAQKRGISTKQLLSTTKPNPKHKNNEILTTKLSQKVAKTQQKVAKTQKKVAKTLQKVAITQQKVVKFKITIHLTPQKSLKLEKRKNTQNLTYEKPLKITKQQILSKTKKKKKKL